MRITKTEVLIETYADVDFDLEVEDVVEFIGEAEKDDLEKIQLAINERGAATGVRGTLIEFEASTLKHLIDEANQFGIKDMLDLLRREAERYGLYLQGDFDEKA